ncbi:hypothetical protein D3C81_1723760 [compost metagenome]
MPMKDFDVVEYISCIWGMEQGEKVKVKVKFLKEVDVENKIKRDLKYRKNKILEEYDGFFLYEDIVIGINSFRAWIRSYGSSAIVLEPKELRDSILDSAKKCLEYYK